ncbi:MAG TPA: VacJ family lipoprotein [Verrucomicrobiae bacterium]|jgi:ABC-type transporter lipoprotein component MlaA|nr:VacJ family lipoprotein [Verrucomicrobiae bacterium]
MLTIALLAVPAAAATNEVVLPASVPDPLEPFNRAMWGLNRALLLHVIKPTAPPYRFVVRPPVRRGIANFGRNMLYPERAFNHLLQGRWSGAGIETERFLANSVVGVAGLFDVATKWGIGKSDADFGQTFGVWGWHPQFFLMLPFFGPSNDRDAVGLAAQAASNPMTYFTPFAYIPYFVDYNNIADGVEDYARFSQAEMDPYALAQYAWTFARENRVADYHVTGEIDQPSLETLQYVYFSYDDPEFPARAKTGSAYIEATHRTLKFTYWLQPHQAPVVYIIPGLGSHRLAESSIALAELVYKNGFSAVSISSPFNSEFMENAATAEVPGFTPVDGEDLRHALAQVDRALERKHPGRLGSRGVMGYSMGAYETLYLAATATNQTDSVAFDRYVAINTPVRLIYGAEQLDNFYEAPLGWPAPERTHDIENTFLKVAGLSQMTIRPSTQLPFDAIESRFLIGLTYRFILRDIIYDSQSRHNQGVLKRAIKPMDRRSLYDEIMQYSYLDYFRQFVVPAYRERGVDLQDPKTLAAADDLRTYSAGLRSNREVRLVGTYDDFLLSHDDLTWMQSTFPTNQITLFPQGGHLGNLANPAVQRRVLAALEELRSVPQTKRVLTRPTDRAHAAAPPKVP